MNTEYMMGDEEMSKAAAVLVEVAKRRNVTSISVHGKGFSVYVVLGSAYVQVATQAFHHMHEALMESGFCVEHGMNTCSEDCPGRPVQEKPDETV